LPLGTISSSEQWPHVLRAFSAGVRGAFRASQGRKKHERAEI
jgi:hypothetical protein